jgi:hypothetical protein
VIFSDCSTDKAQCPGISFKPFTDSGSGLKDCLPLFALKSSD